MARTPTTTDDTAEVVPFDRNAHLFNPDERAVYIDSILQGAIARAVTFIRRGRTGRGEYELVRALLRVARITGDTSTVIQLEDLRYFEIGGK